MSPTTATFVYLAGWIVVASPASAQCWSCSIDMQHCIYTDNGGNYSQCIEVM